MTTWCPLKKCSPRIVSFYDLEYRIQGRQLGRVSFTFDYMTPAPYYMEGYGHVRL